MKLLRWFNSLPTFPRELLRALYFILMLSVAHFIVIELSILRTNQMATWGLIALLSVCLSAIIVGVCAAFSVRWKNGWE